MRPVESHVKLPQDADTHCVMRGRGAHVMTMQNNEVDIANELTILPLVTYTRAKPPAARRPSQPQPHQTHAPQGQALVRAGDVPQIEIRMRRCTLS